MTFNFEKFGDAEQQSIDYAAFRKNNLLGAITNRSWVVDRERNAFLLWGGVEREPPFTMSYYFSVDGILFRPQFHEDSQRLPDGTFATVLTFLGWGSCSQYPEPTDIEKERAMALLPEALEEFDKGMSSSPQRTLQVIFKQ